MSDFQLFAVTPDGPQRIHLPERIVTTTDLYRGLQRGVYSALRTFDHNKFLCLEDHLARTRYSMAQLGWTYNLDEESLRAALHQVVTEYPGQDSRVRFDILAQPAYEIGSYSRVLITLSPFTPIPERYYFEGVGVDFTTRLVRDNPRVKTADFAQDRQEMLPQRTQEHYEYLILGPEGEILEGTLTNFWAVRQGVVYTAREGILEGITRKIILTIIERLNIPLRLMAVSKDDLPTLDEAAVSGSSRALMPVVRIDRQVIGSGYPGPITLRILEAYQHFVSTAVKTAVSEG